jgi:hypothetical protein
MSLADTNVHLGVVSKDVLDLCEIGRVVVVDLNDVEKLRILISIIALEHKVVKKDVPACNIIY